MEINKLKILWDETHNELMNKHVFIVCNTKSASRINASEDSKMATEYFSDDEFEEVVGMFSALSIPLDFFTYEDDFFSHVLNNPEENWVDFLVYNAAQSGFGPGRKSLIPAFCNLHRLKCTGSNAYVVSLCRHKYHVNKLLAQHGVHVPQTWLYSNGWGLNGAPPEGSKIIIKPIHESASIGIEEDAVQIYKSHTDALIYEKMQTHMQSIIVQEFIDGYEAETPIVRIGNEIYLCEPVGISIGNRKLLKDNFLDYKHIYFDQYNFYDFSSTFHFAPAVEQCAKTVAEILGMEGLCRVDFRIKPDGTFYVTDVSTNPHFVFHSSISFAFRAKGLNKSHIVKTILGAAIRKEIQ